MAKAPRAGAVKTRLARQIGEAEALRFARVTADNIIRRLAGDARWRTVLAISPDGAAARGSWPPGAGRMAQGPGDLGARLQRVMDRMPPGPVVIVGTDIPQLQPTHVARAFRLLAGHDAVVGPAQDGGYWLVGLRRGVRVLAPFAGVRWGTAHALADTRENLGQARVALADTLADVDEAESHRRLRGAGARLVLGPPAYRCR